MMFAVLVALAVLTCGGRAAAQDNDTDINTDAAAVAMEEAARRELAEANNAFALELYQALRPHDGNLIMSPFSASAVLALAWMGTAGTTAEQLGNALHIPSNQERVAMGVRALFDTLQESNDVIVKIANKMFVQRNFTVKDVFRQRAVNSFHSDAETLDFLGQNEAARQSINQWVEQVTEAKIKNLFREGTLDVSSVVVLVNAIYFKGEWMKAFKENGTRDEPFYTSANSSVNVPMMTGIFHAGHATIPGVDATALELMYKGSSMRMLVLLPNEIDGLQALEDHLGSINFTSLQFYRWEVEIKMPKFKIESELSLKDSLEKLGVQDLFTSRCNLTGLTDNPNVQVSKVLQKAFVEVNEKGTEAAAATAVEVIARSGRRRILFQCNHPFLFLIQGADRTILFMGRVTNPSAI